MLIKKENEIMPRCPKCNHIINKYNYNAGSSYGGFAHDMLHKAIGAYRCDNCGKLRLKDFPIKIRVKLALKNIFTLLIFIASITAIFIFIYNSVSR